jgi:hypothetical protein
MTIFMLSTASVLQQFTGTSKVMSGACTTLGMRHQFDEIYTNAAQLYSEENNEFS